MNGRDYDAEGRRAQALEADGWKKCTNHAIRVGMGDTIEITDKLMVNGRNYMFGVTLMCVAPGMFEVFKRKVREVTDETNHGQDVPPPA